MKGSRLGHLIADLHPGEDVQLLQSVLQGKRVYDGSQHTHVVGAGAVHPAYGGLFAPDNVAAANHYGDINARVSNLFDVRGNRLDACPRKCHSPAFRRKPWPLSLSRTLPQRG